jgi:ABC-type uncharacterized transport system substrate-binding protein
MTCSVNSRRRFLQRSLRVGLGAVGAGILTACTARSSGQDPSTRLRRIGFLAFGPEPRGATSNFDAFVDSLRELGYVEGESLAIERRWSLPDNDQFDALVAQLIAIPVDVIVASGAPAIRAAMRATSTVPIVMAPATGDPVAAGLVASLAQPGGNVTGLTTLSARLSGKRVEKLRDVLPTITSIGVLWNPSMQEIVLDWQETQSASQMLGLDVVSLEVRSASDLRETFAAATSERVDGLVVLSDPLTFRNRAQIVELASQNRLPAVYPLRGFVDAGGLMAYGPHLQTLFRRSADYVDKILKGMKPSELPVEQPARFEFVLNLHSAQALGLTIPRSVLVDATDVVR